MKKKVTALATVAVLSSAFSTNVFADTYTVKKGDTLSHIAHKYDTRVADIKKLNGLNSDMIYVNQKLKLSNSVSAVKASSNQPAASKASAAVKAKTYKVVSGDTLSRIAQRHNISLASLKSWNKLRSDLIFPGQVLVVSNAGNAPIPAQTVTNPTPSKQPASTGGSGKASTYTIKSGDTLGKIARQFGMSVSTLKALNNLSSDLIYAGKVLKVSGTVQAPSTGVQKENNQPAPAVTSGYQVQNLINEAKSHIGTPYVWGGTSAGGFDCSGFIYYVFNKAGKKMDRTSAEGYYSRSYYVSKPQPGDLVFFENTYKKGISHLGIYVGNNSFIHADNSGVRVTSLDNSYYKSHFEGYKRFY